MVCELLLMHPVLLQRWNHIFYKRVLKINKTLKSCLRGINKLGLNITLTVWAHQCVYFENITNSQFLKCHHLSPTVHCTGVSTIRFMFLPWGLWNEEWDLWEVEQVSEKARNVVQALRGNNGPSVPGQRLTWTYHVDGSGSPAEDHEVGHSKWSCNSYKVFQHILLPNLFFFLKEQKKKKDQTQWMWLSRIRWL